jgi:hypothetical protein
MPPAFAHCCSADGREPGCETNAQPVTIDARKAGQYRLDGLGAQRPASFFANVSHAARCTAGHGVVSQADPPKIE